MTAWINWVFLVSGYVAGAACAIHALLYKTRDASGTLVWIVFCLTIPWIGALFYVTIGDDRIIGRRRRRIVAAHAAYRGRRTGPGGERRQPEISHPQLHRLADTEVHRGNDVDVDVGGKAAYARMLAAISKAQVSVALQTYILDDDEIGIQFRDALVERAKAGVKVRVLYDAIGAARAAASFFHSFQEGGVPIRPFLPFHPFKRRWQINLRNHRKIMVVDGVHGFIGSMNVSARHISFGTGASYDCMISVQGPAVRDLLEIFASDWLFASGERLAEADFFPPIPAMGQNAVQVIESGPDRQTRGLHKVAVAAIYEAREEILILTPYFIPPLPVLNALETAALRGVRVRVVIPVKTDNSLVDMAMPHFLEPALRAGVIVAYRPGPMLHMKMLLVDDDLAVAGSSNMDQRSFFLNFEADLVVYGGSAQKQFREIGEVEWKASAPITYEEIVKRPILHRALHRAAALFAPVL